MRHFVLIQKGIIMLKILAIGNSFSCDCTQYLYEICTSAGVDAKIGNLYIGGCSLERHANNIKNRTPDYEYFINSLSQDCGFSANYAIESDDWDIVTMQQCSNDSGKEESYRPYFDHIYSYVKEKLPNTEIVVNQTWAYETDSNHSAFPFYKCDQLYMYERLCCCYKMIAEEFGCRLIPVGDVIQTLRNAEGFRYGMGERSLCRDGFHLDYCYGRYAAASVWYEFLTGKDITDNCFSPPAPDGIDTATHQRLIFTVKNAVHCCLLNKNTVNT